MTGHIPYLNTEYARQKMIEEYNREAKVEFITNVKVKCDKCGWILAVDHKEIPSWHNKQCPQCNDCIIVNDGDLELYQAMLIISALQNELNPDPKDMVKVRISSERAAEPATTGNNGL